MIATPYLELKSNTDQLWPGYTAEFPYVCMLRHMDDCIGKKIAWHWHTALEIDYIEEGEIEYRIPEGAFTVHKGEAVFINSNTLHTVTAKGRGSRLLAHLFDKYLISGMFDSIYERKYVMPVLENPGIQVYIIRPDNAVRVRLIEKMFRLIDVYDLKQEGYEFEIRSLLSEIWYFLYRDVTAVTSLKRMGSQPDAARILKMMQYIQEHFHEKISMNMIAESANISVRECDRCFQNKIGMSPGNYLNDYRIRTAAALLLRTEDSITEIAEKCGFSSSSYFGKSFFKMIGCTPKQYRRAAQEKTIENKV